MNTESFLSSGMTLSLETENAVYPSLFGCLVSFPTNCLIDFAIVVFPLPLRPYIMLICDFLNKLSVVGFSKYPPSIVMFLKFSNILLFMQFGVVNSYMSIQYPNYLLFYSQHLKHPSQLRERISSVLGSGH